MNKQICRFSNDTGDAQLTVYSVFPGAEITFHSIHMDELSWECGSATSSLEGSSHLLEIHHCREGRIEQAFDDTFFYLMPGDLSVARRQTMVKAYRFPLRHYHGITIGIDLTHLSDDFRRMLSEIGVEPGQIARKLCGGRSCFIVRAEENIEHILSELYTAPEALREGYIKLKMMELLLVLSHMETSRDLSTSCALPQSQVQLAHQAAAYLADNRERHVTVQELSRQLGISPTQLKAIFRGVYGQPVFTYMRTQRMQEAAQLLIHTDRPIGEIAEMSGYTNASKFAAAFQDVMGETPREFRQAHTQQRK